MAIATAGIGIDTAAYVVKDTNTPGHRDAIKWLKAEIVTLLQHATLYSLTVMLRTVLQRYVFMLRGLMKSSLPYLCTPSDQLPKMSVSPAVGHTSPGCFGRISKANYQVDSSDKVPAMPATAQLVHDLSTLQPWQDNLDALVLLLAPTTSVGIPANPMPESLPVETLTDWAWYVELVQLPVSANIQKRGPPSHIPVTGLLELLGVGPTMLPLVQQQLGAEHITLLKEAVLPRFIDAVIACIDDQVPGLDLSALHVQTPLLHGMAQRTVTSGTTKCTWNCTWNISS